MENTKALFMMRDAYVNRVKLGWKPASEGKRFAKVMTEFVYEVKGLDLSRFNVMKVGRINQ